MGVSLAVALCAVARDAQELLVVAAAQHRLSARESLALVAAYLGADDDRARASLLAAPLATVRPARHFNAPPELRPTHFAERLRFRRCCS